MAAPARQRAEQDPFFVPERRARTPAARAAVDIVRERLRDWQRTHGDRQRRRRRADQEAHGRMVEALVCEAVRRDLLCPGGAVALSLGRQRNTRYVPAPYAPMRDLLTALGRDVLAFLVVTWGSRPDEGRGRMTTFAATPRLRELTAGLGLADFGRRAGGEPVVLRNTRERVAQHGSDEVADAFETWVETRAELGDLVNYRSNETADRLRADMNRINATLDEADLTLDPAAMTYEGAAAVVDAGDRWLRRVFNNGHIDFRHGGRLTGGFWMDLPKAVRLRAIRIGGEPVVELDFQAMMPRLLYAHAGQTFPPDEDPYALPGIPPKCRDGVKKLFASLTFGPTALQRWPRGCRQLFPPRTRRETVIRLFRHHHATVADHFGTLIGFQLQRVESDILVAVLLTCRERGIVVLPIHDAVLCRASRADEVEEVMLEAFRAITGGGMASVSRSKPLPRSFHAPLKTP